MGTEPAGRRSRGTARLAVATLALAVLRGSVQAADLPLERIELPPGFRIGLYASDVPDARSLALGSAEVVFVGSRRAGTVTALLDRDRDGRAEARVVVASGLRVPNGVAMLGEDLYVAENHRILRYPDILDRLDRPPEPEVVLDGLPREGHHGWRYLGAGPDGYLYFAIGAPCNVCEEPGFAEIRRVRPDGSAMETYAHGVRNSVGFDWHPGSGELWFTDNGRDWLGDDLPPDELNRAPRPGAHFGFPYCHGRDISDPDFGRRRDCAEFTPPARELGPHVASLGMRFYTGTMFPPPYRGQIFIAEHGSWNRSSRIGYRVSLVELDGERAVAYRTFASGWLGAGRVWGRPVDVLVLPDGSLLVSDDYADAVYRIWYEGG